MGVTSYVGKALAGATPTRGMATSSTLFASVWRDEIAKVSSAATARTSLVLSRDSHCCVPSVPNATTPRLG